jgi:hypothetical protein
MKAFIISCVPIGLDFLSILLGNNGNRTSVINSHRGETSEGRPYPFEFDLPSVHPVTPLLATDAADIQPAAPAIETHHCCTT